MKGKQPLNRKRIDPNKLFNDYENMHDKSFGMGNAMIDFTVNSTGIQMRNVKTRIVDPMKGAQSSLPIIQNSSGKSEKAKYNASRPPLAMNNK